MMQHDNFPLKASWNRPLILDDVPLRLPQSCQARLLLLLHWEQPSCRRRSVDVSQHQVEAATHPVATVTGLLHAEPDQAG